MENTFTQAIYNLYSEYISWSAEFLAECGGLNIVKRMFTGNAEYNRRPEHMKFFSDCRAEAEKYLEDVRNGAGREELMPLLRYVFISCHESCDDVTEWMLMAAEKNFIPFADELTKAEAEELYKPYRSLRRKNRGMPPQDELLKKLKELSK